MNGLGRKEEKQIDKQSLFTKETFGVILLLFSTLCVVCLITRGSIFYQPGEWINSFLFGVFGYFAYGVMLFLISVSVMLIVGKKPIIPTKLVWLFTAFFCLLVLLLHAVSLNDAEGTFGEYLTASYMAGQNGVSGSTAGGLIMGLVAYWFLKILSATGCFVIISLLIVGDIFLIVKYFRINYSNKESVSKEKFRSSYVGESSLTQKLPDGVEISGEVDYPEIERNDNQSGGTQRLFVNNASDFNFKTKKEISKGEVTPIRLNQSSNGGLSVGSVLTNSNGADAQTTNDQPTDYQKKIEYIKTPASINLNVNKYGYGNSQTVVSDYITRKDRNSTDYSSTVNSNRSGIEENGQSSSDEFSITSTQNNGNSGENTNGSQDVLSTIPFFEHDESKLNADGYVFGGEQTQKQNGTQTSANEVGGVSDVKRRAEEFSSRYLEVPEDSTEGGEVKDEPTEIFRPLNNDRQGENANMVNANGEQDVDVKPSNILRNRPINLFGEQRKFDAENVEQAKSVNGDNSQSQTTNVERSIFESKRESVDNSNLNGQESDLDRTVRERNHESRAVLDNGQNKTETDKDQNSRVIDFTASRRTRMVDDGNANNTDNKNANNGVNKDSRAFNGFVRRGENDLAENADKEEVKQEKPKPPINRVYNRPPIDLLERHTVSVNAKPENHEERMEIIKRTLGEFRIDAEPQSYVQGPAITRYEIMMPAGISVKKVLSYDDDLRMRLASRFGVRIEAPIPGKNLVGIEVANATRIPVGLREVLEGAAGKPSKAGALTFAIGKDIVGNSITDNLAKGPHYLIAGATGSGKSVALNVMIVSLIMRYSPEELRLILIDPKRVGFRTYEHIPHLMIDEIVTEPQKAVAVLNWAYNEMERRYGVFESCEQGVISDIDAYNERVASDTVPKMPRIVIIVDELADLMESCKKDMDIGIRKLAAKARAAGVHLVLATQRPSVDVITGTIKANLPSRMALKVMNFADSNTILSEGGAEKLLGNGDMLYKNSSMNETERYQGAFVTDQEIANVVKYIKDNNTAYFDDELKEFLEKSVRPPQEENTSNGGEDSGEADGEVNEFFLKALWLAVNTGSVSISQLQRRFSIGFARAGGLVDKMERMGFVSPNEGSKARRVLLTREEFVERFGTMSDTY